MLWISDFYLCSFWQTLKGILPIGLLGSFQERVFIQLNSLEDLGSLKGFENDANNDAASLGSITSVLKIFSEEKMIDVAEVKQRRRLETAA